MLFRTKDSAIVNIDRIMFNNDKEYYSYIKAQVVGENVKNKGSIVDDLVLLIKNKSTSQK